MKRNILIPALFTLGIFVNAQVLTHVDTNALVYVSKSTLVYNGGGLQTKATGKIENHGNIMISGDGSDLLRTLDGSNNAKTDGGNIINKINEPTAYASVNTSGNIVYTYGQLFITGLSQNNITGVVDQEYRQTKHGTYQQFALPFFGKTLSSLSAPEELNKTFNNTRWSENEILRWNNRNVVFDNVNISSQSATGTDYYILGSKNLDTSTKVYTLKGRPVAEENAPNVVLQDAGKDINFGAGGNAINGYNEKYNSYLQDGFHIASGGTAWNGNFGRNIYQFGNPFMTNLDLSKVSFTEGATVGDGNFLENIQAIRFEVSGVQFSPIAGGGSSSYKFVTFSDTVSESTGTPEVPVGDVDYMMVRPFGTFVIKLKDNTKSNTLNFTTLRRFNYLPRNGNTNYSVTAAKGSASAGTVKQLGIIGLNSSGNEVSRTYYVVSSKAVTGRSINATTQITNPSTSYLGTFEEDPVNGGYDMNAAGSYWLYINEANETNFKGKNIKLVNYNLNNIKSYKFEIRENAELISDGTHLLSSGTGFYYKASDGILKEAKQGQVITVSGAEYDLYYGKPDGVLAANGGDIPSRTKVVYDPSIEDYVVIFDPNWKTADIDVYDMSGRLVLSAAKVKTNTNYTIRLNTSVRNGYIVKIIADNGEKVTTKILK